MFKSIRYKIITTFEPIVYIILPLLTFIIASFSTVSAVTFLTISTLTLPFLSKIPNTGILFLEPFSLFPFLLPPNKFFVYFIYRDFKNEKFNSQNNSISFLMFHSFLKLKHLKRFLLTLLMF